MGTKLVDKNILSVARQKICIAYFILFIVVSIVSGVLGYQYIVNNLIESIRAQVQLEQLNISKYFSEEQIKLEGLNRQIQKADNVLVIKDLLSEHTAHNDRVIAYYMGFEDGSSYFGDEWVPPSDYYATEQKWYKLAIAEQMKIVYTEPYIDTMSGKLVITLAQSVQNKQGENIGVVAMDVFITDIVEPIKKNKITIKNYSVLIDQEGNVLNHENKDYLPTSDRLTNMQSNTEGSQQQLYSRLLDEGSVLAYAKDYDGKIKLFVIQKLENEWYMGVVISYQEIAERLIKILSIITGILFITFIVIYYISMKTIKYNVKPIMALALDIEEVAAGDLTVINTINRNDELGKLATNMNVMVQETAEIIKGTKELTQNIVKSTEQITHMTYAHDKALTRVTTMVTDMGKDDTIQVVNYEKTNGMMQQLAGNFMEIKEEAESILKAIKETNELAQNSNHIMNTLEVNNTKVNDAMYFSLEKVQQLQQEIEEVNKVTQYIIEIADQTQLLSLNASIEAARSGDDGKGFSTIAKEIGKLSDVTKHSNAKIKEVFKSLSEHIQMISDAAKTVAGHMGEQNESIKITKTMLQEVQQQLQNTSNNTKKTFTYINEVTYTSQEVRASMEVVQKIIEQNSDRIQKITEMIQKQSISSKEVVVEIERLDAMSGRIEKRLSAFQTQKK